MASTRSSFTGFCLLESSTWSPQALTRVAVFFLPYCCPSDYTLVSAYIYLCTHPQSHPRTPQTFSNFTAGCLLVRARLKFLAPGISKQSLVIISPSLQFSAVPFFPFVLAIFHTRRHLCMVWDQLSAVLPGKLDSSPFLSRCVIMALLVTILWSLKIPWAAVLAGYNCTLFTYTLKPVKLFIWISTFFFSCHFRDFSLLSKENVYENNRLVSNFTAVCFQATTPLWQTSV